MFHDRSSNLFPGVSSAGRAAVRSALASELGITDLQIAESVAFSMSMVVRAALGLHANQAEIAVLVHDSLPGWIALATARHLINAGSRAQLVEWLPSGTPTPIFSQLRRPLDVLGTQVRSWDDLIQSGETESFLSSCHALICGIDALHRHPQQDSLCQVLNEHSIPVHSIELPLGLDPDTGIPAQDTLYASSTLCLGIPLEGLDAGAEFAGRLYLADISLSSVLIEHLLKLSFPILFAEQPVIQIFPVRDIPPEDTEP